MSQNLILFDFDGVLLNNKKINDYVVDKSVEYVEKRVNCSKSRAKIINNKVYHKLGHTAKLFGNHKKAVQDYNDFVFNETTLKDVKKLLNENDEKHFNDVIRMKKDFSYGIFTNTSSIWYTTILDHYNIYNSFDSNYCFDSDNGLIKPNPISYDSINQCVPSNLNIHFLDDNKLNILPACSYDRWSNYLISDNLSLYWILNSVY